MKKFLPLFLILHFSFLISSCGSWPALPENEQYNATLSVSGEEEAPILKILALDVGQGDSTLLVLPNQKGVLIDCGPPGSEEGILATLAQEGVLNLEAIFISHYHLDHVGGCPEGVGEEEIPFWNRGQNPLPFVEGYQYYQENIFSEQNILQPGEIFSWGDLFLTIPVVDGVLSNGESYVDPNDENALSAGFLIEFKKFRFFIGGDITGGGGIPPYQTVDLETPLAPLIGDIDVLRVAHHGSYTSSNAHFLDGVTPEVAIISVGDDNEFGHPHAEVLDRLREHNIEVWQTQYDGTVEIVTDGNTYKILSTKP